MNKDMIERLKNNKRPFSLMDDDPVISEDMQEAAEEIGRNEFIVYWPDEGGDDGWVSDEEAAKQRYFASHMTYRLRADYEPEKPEPEVVECEVCTSDINLIYYYNELGIVRSLLGAVEYPNFIGYKYPEGLVSASPRLSTHQDKPAEIPTHVLFAKGE